ncbi:hypothetical protein SAMN05660443_0634 [Marinospirillum celere]|uniref:Uncharacterized protein n=2 Tax=Marinospirillum celere TaxID=1122252 RepID=A0A1I1EIT8_9GAMM|nr:hypothetical protein SAMN05660443_0634 [Marinospirillum celere]
MIGITSKPHPVFHGQGRGNICNQGEQGGLQLELTPFLRLNPLAFFKRRRLIKVLSHQLTGI